MPLGTEIGLGPADMGTRVQGKISPLFSAHVYCGHGRPSQLLLSACIAPFMKHLASKLQSENFYAGIVGTRDHFHT